MTKEQLQMIHDYLALVYVSGPAKEVSGVLNEIGALQQAISQAIAEMVLPASNNTSDSER